MERHLTAPRSEFDQVPWVRNVPDPPRVVPLNSFYDDFSQEWFLFVPVEEGRLGRMAGGEVAQGPYYARRPVSPDRDTEVPLGTLLTQHLSFPEALDSFGKIVNGLENFAAVLEKYKILWAHSSDHHDHSTTLVQTELEYLVMLSRSVYDLLQKVAKAVSAQVVLLDGSNKRAFDALPDSFAKVVLDGDKLRTRAEIKNRFGLPAPLASFYEEEGPSFKRLRELRDAIVHHGNSPSQILHHDSGFAVLTDHKPWAEFPWEESNLRANHLGSLRFVFLSLIKQTVHTTTRYAMAFGSCVKLPEPIGPGIKVFLRHPYGRNLAELNGELAKPWEGEQPTREEDASG